MKKQNKKKNHTRKKGEINEKNLKWERLMLQSGQTNCVGANNSSRMVNQISK